MLLARAAELMYVVCCACIMGVAALTSDNGACGLVDRTCLNKHVCVCCQVFSHSCHTMGHDGPVLCCAVPAGVRGPQFLSLLVKSMKGDASIKRVAAFAKRLLQVGPQRGGLQRHILSCISCPVRRMRVYMISLCAVHYATIFTCYLPKPNRFSTLSFLEP